jgi:RNA polymerase sigma-70 factor (ECF subfamily)
VPPASWAPIPEERLLADETLERVDEAIAALPPAQRAVIALRDVEGWSSAETRAALDLSEGNQRVLLHRARSKVRAALEDYLR